MTSGCALNRTAVGPTDLLNAQAEIPEEELLDVGIELFNPGKINSDDENDENKILAEIRKSESRFLPNHLKNTLQRTGQWGAVRVTPAESYAMDVNIAGEIIESDGDILVVKITAADATGKVWFEKTYEAEAGKNAYKHSTKGEKDAFQDLYNTIANDLANAKNEVTTSQLRIIRKTSELKFAADIAPDAFGDYLVKTEDGLYIIDHLPAENDSMMDRVGTLREREYMLIDTVNEYYDLFYDGVWDSYGNWRKSHREELLAMRDIESSARNRYMLGAAAIIGAIALEMLGSGNTSTLRNVMVVGGAVAIKSGMDKSDDANIHEDAIQEMDESFNAEVAPMVLDIEGQTVKLTGSAEEQYLAWRQLLKDIYISETDFEIQSVSDVNTIKNPNDNPY